MHCALTLGALSCGHADVVISEIMYRPGAGYPEDTSREFIELYNDSTSGIDVSGWALTSGAGYTIPVGTTIAASGYLVIAGFPVQVQTAYGITGVLGPWTAGATLSNNGEKITLSRQVAGVWEKVDEVSYASEGDWATRIREAVYNGWDWSTPANGGDKSLELRNSALTNNNGQNWAPSTAPAGATPGTANSVTTGNVAPIIQDVKHFPAVPKSTDNVTISCRVSDETPAASLTATVFWRVATTTTPGAFQGVPMAGDGSGVFAAVLQPQANLAIVEFYVRASDGVNTRTWPAPTLQGQIASQNANCQYQVDNTPPNNADSFYRLVLTGAENSAFENVSSDSDRQFNQTLVVTRGAETTIRYRAAMRIRGASSRTYMFKPLRISVPNDDPLDGISTFNLNPRSSYLQYLGMRAFQAVGLPASDAIPVELRRNGVEETTSGGDTPDFGKWTRMEDVNADTVRNHWPAATGGNIYKKVRPEAFWRSGGGAPSTPDGDIDGWTKQNNSGANDWSDLMTFFGKWQTNAAPHFPDANPGNVASGTWDGMAFTAGQIADIETVSDLDQWARWFAVMTILQSNETNISNGADDDHTAYFVPSAGGQRRMQLYPHDLDTIFGLGDSPLTPQERGLYDPTDDAGSSAVFPPLLPLFGNNSTLGNEEFRAKYFIALRELFGGVLNANTTGNPNPPFHQFINNHLPATWVNPTRVGQIRTFATQRQTYLLGLIGAPAITPPPPTSTATVTSAHGNLMIHQVLANNAGVVDVGGAFPDIIELRNTGPSEVDLSGMSLTDDPAAKAKFVFPAGTTIPANGYLTVYADAAVGSPRTGFALDQGGETLQLYDTVAAGQGLIDSIAFGAQPANYSIGRTGPALDVWALCTPTTGAANAAVGAFAAITGVRINEWLGNVDYQFDDDFVELYNPAAQSPVPLGGMTVTYGPGSAAETHTLPPLSFIGPASFLSLEAKGSAATPGNATELPYKLSSSFGAIALRGENGALVDRADIVGQTSDTSTGRSTNGSITLARFGLPTTLASPGASNVAPPASVLALMNGLRITEILYAATPNTLDFIELQNIGSTTLDLSGVRFTRGVTYTFPATTLVPGAFIVVCKDRDAFIQKFGGAVRLADGNFSGTLSDTGETIALRPPLPWEANILRFDYDPAWYPATASGHSLTVANAQATAPGDWDERSTWSPSAAPYGTPGSDGPPTITSLLAISTIAGDPFQYQITATKFPTLFGASSLPAGLTINTSTGLISGAPAESGVFGITIRATNAGGTDTKQLVLTVASSGPLASFAWTAIPSPQLANVPFNVSLTALDAQGRVVTSFNGDVTLTGIGAGGTSASVVFTELSQAQTDYFELQNVSGAPVNTTGWYVVINDTTNSDPNLIHATLWNLPATTATNQVLYATESFFDHYFGERISWSNIRPGWAMLVDNLGVIRDFMVWGYGPAQIASINLTLRGFTLNPAAQNAWTGASVAGSDPSTVHLRTGNRDNDTAPDFAIGAPSLGTQNPGLTLPFMGGTPIPITPGAATFQNGVFSGTVTIATVTSGIRITAKDAGGKSVQSNLFDTVNARAPVIMSAPSAVAAQGQPFSFQIVVDTYAQSYGASNLPADLSINTATGLISGIPNAAGPFPIDLSAANPSGTGNATLNLTVQGDTDGDGMGNAWESANGLNPNFAGDASGDLDGDGQSNLDEWLAGTSPNDGSSRFAILSETVTGANVQIIWHSVAGKRYRVRARADLTSGAWTNLTATPIPATGATTGFTHIGGKSGSARYYRVEVVP